MPLKDNVDVEYNMFVGSKFGIWKNLIVEKLDASVIRDKYSKNTNEHGEVNWHLRVNALTKAPSEHINMLMLSRVVCPQDDTVEELVLAQLPAEAVQNLNSSNWKERLAAMEKFTEVHLVTVSS